MYNFNCRLRKPHRCLTPYNVFAAAVHPSIIRAKSLYKIENYYLITSFITWLQWRKPCINKMFAWRFGHPPSCVPLVPKINNLMNGSWTDRGDLLDSEQYWREHFSVVRSASWNKRGAQWNMSRFYDKWEVCSTAAVGGLEPPGNDSFIEKTRRHFRELVKAVTLLTANSIIVELYWELALSWTTVVLTAKDPLR